jgi:hypothetical protein
MIIRASVLQALPRAFAAFVLFSLGLSLSACADMSDSVSAAFADPAKYDLYDCKQLEAERKSLAARSAELQGLMTKAETGFAGPVVAELAYRNEYIAVRGQARFAEEAWQKNKCRETPPAPVAVPAKPGLHAKSTQRSKPAQRLDPAQRSDQRFEAAPQFKPAPSGKSGGGAY